MRWQRTSAFAWVTSDSPARKGRARDRVDRPSDHPTGSLWFEQVGIGRYLETLWTHPTEQEGK